MSKHSVDLPPVYSPHTPRRGWGDSYPLESFSPGSSPQWNFEKPRLKSTRSTTTLQQVRGAFEERYGTSPSLPPGSPRLQSHYTTVDLGIRRPLARKFDPYRQLVRLLLKGFVRWMVSVLIITATITSIWGYSQQEILSRTQSRVFNALTTGLLLALNMNIQSAFKQAAIFMRWKIISNRRQTLAELDLTMGIDSLIRVIKLGWLARAKPFMLLGCVAWIGMNITVFALIATVQLTYSLQDSAGAIYEAGKEVSIVKLDHWYPKNESDVVPSIGGEQATAHMYGFISNTYKLGNASDFAASLKTGRGSPANGFLTYDLVDHWVAQLLENNPSVDQTFYTNRTINSTWLCTSYEVVEGGNGDTTNISYRDGDTIRSFDVGETGPGATTYITETEEVCGPRCARVWAFQSKIEDKSVPPTFYDCNITMSNVSNPTLPEHILPDMQARIAAGAIGLDGFRHDNTTKQWVRFHEGDWWAIGANYTPHDAGWLIGQFAAGVIGSAGQINSPVLAIGTLAVAGSALTVNWKFFVIVLLALGILQLIVSVFAIMLANSVVVKDDSRLAEARLLRPFLERLGPSGCILDGKGISKTLRAEVVYGVRQAGQWHHLDIGTDIKPLKLLGSFPPGWYDGEPEDEGLLHDETSSEEHMPREVEQRRSRCKEKLKME